MSEREQPIHLYLGDQYTAGMRPTAEAAPYNSDDQIRPIMRWLTGGSQDDVFYLPSPITVNEWGLEHVLEQIMDTATLNFVATVTQARCKVAVDDAKAVTLTEGGSIRNEVDTMMARAALEVMFANMEPSTLFLLNLDTSFSGTPQRRVDSGLRPANGVFETEGFTIKVDPTHAFSAARNDLIVQLDANNRVNLPLTTGENAVSVTVGGSTDTTGTWQSGAGEDLYITVDWKRKKVTVTLASRGQELASATLTNGDWSGLENTDAYFGVYDGTIYAPFARPVYAAPRAELIVIQMGANIGTDADADTEAATWVEAITQMRNEPWGAQAPVWFVLPPEDVPTAGTALRARASMLKAASQLQNVMCFETRHLTRATVSGDDVLTGASLITLSNTMLRDWSGIISSRKRYLGRPRHTGFRRFENATDANAFIQDLIDAGLTTREVSPHLGGPGERSGNGVDGPWNIAKTTREAGDHFADPNTGERLVPIDLAAAKAGFRAPARGIRIVPSTAGSAFASATPPTLNTDPLIDYRNVATARASEAHLYDRVNAKAEHVSGIRPKVFSQTGSPLNLLTPPVTWSDINDTTITTGQADPVGGTGAVLLEDTNAGVTANADTPDGTLVGTDPAWVGLWLKRDAASTNFATVYAREVAAVLAGVHVDFANGRIADSAVAPQASMLRRFGDWYFVAFRYATTANNVSVAVRPSAGLTASFPTTSTQTGSCTVFGPVIANVTSLTDRVANTTPYAYNAQPRVLLSEHLVVEGARTNQMPYGVDLGVSNWSANDGLTRSQSGPGPDGTSYAFDLVDADPNFTGYLQDATVALPTATVHALSVYVKQDLAATHFAGVRVSQGLDTAWCSISLVDGSVTIYDESGFSGTTAYSELVNGHDGDVWYRVTIVFTTTAAAGATVRLHPAVGTVAGATNIGAEGTTTYSMVQCEAGEFSSTFIETEGAAATRATDDHTFTSTEMAAGFYTNGFSVDYYPEHGSADAPTSEALLAFSGSVVYYLKLGTSGSDIVPQIRNGGVERTNGTFAYDRGDKLSFFVEYGDSCTVFKNDVLQLSIDISADGDWSSRSGDTGHLGADFAGANAAHGQMSRVRA